MSRRFLTDIDLIGFSLMQARMHPVSADPSGLGANDSGRVWFNQTSGRFKFWTGTAAIDPLDRAAHQGSQLASTISDFAAAVRALQWSSMLAPSAAVPMGSQRLTAVADPTANTDAATKQYVDNLLSGLTSGQTLKGAVRCATSTNVSLAAPGATLDGVAMQVNDIVLLTGQTTPSQNGPYVWTAAGTALVRATNWDVNAEAALGSYWIVLQGTQADTFALLTNDSPVTLGTTALTFIFRGAAGATYTAGAGLGMTGTDIYIGAGTGILVAADSISIDTSIVARKITGSLPATTSGIFSVSGSTITVNHGLGNPAPLLSAVYGSAGAVPNARVELEETYPDANNAVIVLPSPPVANGVLLTIVG